MIVNYLKIAFRNLVAARWYFALNIGGLAVVLSVSLLLFWWVRDELSYDQFHDDADHIYVVNAHFGGAEENSFRSAPGPAATVAARDIAGVKSAVRIDNYPGKIFIANGKTITEKGNRVYIDENFTEVFSGFKIIYGNPAKPFSSTNAVVLTRSLAEKYFGRADAIGQVVKNVESDKVFTVSAVMEDLPDNSSFRFKMLVPMTAKLMDYGTVWTEKSMDGNWGDYSFEVYLKLTPGTSPELVGQQLTAIKNKASNAEEDGSDYRLQKLTDMHLNPVEGLSSGLKQVKMLGMVGILLLTIGCINYINLTTARANRRNREVGVRKAVGAGTMQVAAQLLVESLLALAVSVICALILIQSLLPFYRSITGKAAQLSITDISLWLILGGTVFLTFLLAGIYPATFIARFQPISALRSRSKTGHGGLRKVLVVTQFVLTTALVAGTFIIGSQLRFITERNPGYSREHVFTFIGGKFTQQFKTALANQPGVKQVSTSTDTPLSAMEGTASIGWDGKDPAKVMVFVRMGIEKNFLSNFKIKLLEGSDFSGTKADAGHYILNETAVRQTGIKNPVGKRLSYEGRNGTIIGVVRDFNVASVRESIRPVVLYSEPEVNTVVHVHTDGVHATEAVATAEKIWKSYFPAYPFEYSFMDQAHNNEYRSERQTRQLFSFFAVVAITVSCLGLLGLVSYMAEQRTKEIGVRKVLGASVTSVVILLSKDFLKLVLIAILISFPLTWYTMELWLQDFAFKVDIGWQIFAFAGLLSMLTAIVTISMQSMRAALMNPVNSLKIE